MAKKNEVTTVEELEDAVNEEEGVSYETPKYVIKFDEMNVENKEEVITVCELASKLISEKYRMSFVDPNTKKSDPKYVGVVFITMYDVIMDIFKNMVESDKITHFELNLMERLVMGFSDSDNEEDEKAGNCMIYMKHLNTDKKDDMEVDPTMKGRELVVRWAVENVTYQPEKIKQICNITAKRLHDDYGISVASSDAVALIFTFVYESLVNFIKLKRRELNEYEYEVNFLNLFFITARQTEDEVKDEIIILPPIKGKRWLKNDEIYSASKDGE